MCMCEPIHVCARVFMYVCMLHVCMYVRAHAHVYVCIHFVCVCMHDRVHNSNWRHTDFTSSTIDSNCGAIRREIPPDWKEKESKGGKDEGLRGEGSSL